MRAQSVRLPTYDLTNFSLREITECGRVVRTMGEGASSMEEVACRIVNYLYGTLINGQTGEQACTLVRFFKTQAYEYLDSELKDFALNSLGDNTPLPR